MKIQLVLKSLALFMIFGGAAFIYFGLKAIK